MKKSKKKVIINDIIMGSTMFICFILYTFVVANCDVRQISGAASQVGLAGFNEIFFKMLPFNEVFYKISEVFGYLTFLLIAFFGLVGVLQLVKRKSLLKVDKGILVLGGFYVLVLMAYVLFEKIIINYRPFVIDVEEGLEASYPSSHTMLAVCVCLSAFVMLSDYIKKKDILKIARIVCIALMVIVVITRLLSGAHWATDIIGGIMLSTTLFSFFVLALNLVKSSKK